jgi:hypothetical protein
MSNKALRHQDFEVKKMPRHVTPYYRARSAGCGSPFLFASEIADTFVRPLAILRKKENSLQVVDPKDFEAHSACLTESG